MTLFFVSPKTPRTIRDNCPLFSLVNSWLSPYLTNVNFDRIPNSHIPAKHTKRSRLFFGDYLLSSLGSLNRVVYYVLPLGVVCDYALTLTMSRLLLTFKIEGCQIERNSIISQLVYIYHFSRLAHTSRLWPFPFGMCSLVPHPNIPWTWTHSWTLGPALATLNNFYFSFINIWKSSSPLIIQLNHTWNQGEHQGSDPIYLNVSYYNDMYVKANLV